MNHIELNYEVKSNWGDEVLWEPGVLVTEDVEEYKRMISFINQNSHCYRVTNVKHIGSSTENH